MTAMIEFDRVSIVFGGAPETALPLMSKRDLAGRILDRVEARLGAE